MVPSVQTRIQDLYDQLPARERRLADVLLEMQGDLAAYSATELAARAGVSKATAARLFRRLGYADYHEMRQQARDERQPGSPLAELEDAGGEKQSLTAHLSHDLQNLTRTVETLRSDAVADAVKILAEARRVWIVGFRNNHALALYARGLLAHVKPDVRMLPVGGYTVAEDLASLSAGDAMLALGFRRRLPVMRSILREAAAVGAKTVLLADPTVDECARHATVTLRCLSRGLTLFDSYVAPMSVLNYLCSQVALRLEVEAEARLERIERLHEAFDDFD
ncbi:MAG TPA: MurR/RpiR family transcriptional regulator [Azospirillaceae bacterium]|nr:MurR/RpiR family transcriptional regulator [Azospirillaceae bacterium]